MTHRQRAINALTHRPVDRPAVQINYALVGFAEHGEALNNLFSKYPGDFEAFSPQPIPVPLQ